MNLSFLRFLWMLISTVVIAAAPARATTQNERQYRNILVGETVTVAARIALDPIDGRWVPVQVIRAHPTGDAKKLRLAKEDAISVDCLTRRIAVLRTNFNLEKDASAEPRWAAAPIDPRINEITSPKEIEHRPPAEIVAESKKELLIDADGKFKAALLAPPYHREPYEVAVDYACSVVTDAIDERAVAQSLLSTSGLTELKTLNCTLRDSEGSRERAVELLVRFHEAMNFVQVQRSWRMTRSVTSDSIYVRHSGGDLQISRLTGRARMDWPGSIAMTGACEQVSDQKKF